MSCETRRLVFSLTMFSTTTSDSSCLLVYRFHSRIRGPTDLQLHSPWTTWTTVGLIASANPSNRWVPRPGFVGSPDRVRSRSNPGQTTSAALASPNSHMFCLLLIYTIPVVQNVSLVVVPSFVLPLFHRSSSVSPPFASGNCLSKCLKAYVLSFPHSHLS